MEEGRNEGMKKRSDGREGRREGGRKRGREGGRDIGRMEGGRGGGVEGGREGLVVVYCLTGRGHNCYVMAIMEWVHIARNGCITGNPSETE